MGELSVCLSVSCALYTVNHKNVPLCFYLSHCYTIAWDRLSNQFFVRVCMYVCISVGTLTVAFFNRSSRNLVRTFESESEELIRLGSKSENAFTYFIPKNQNLADGRHLGFRFWAIMSAWINIFAPNFVQWWKIGSPRRPSAQKSDFWKSKMADGRHLGFRYWAIILASINIFACFLC